MISHSLMSSVKINLIFYVLAKKGFAMEVRFIPLPESHFPWSGKSGLNLKFDIYM